MYDLRILGVNSQEPILEELEYLMAFLLFELVYKNKEIMKGFSVIIIEIEVGGL